MRTSPAIDDPVKTGRAYLLYILARRDYSRSQLEKKLKTRGYSPGDSAAILQGLIDDGYFVEERYTKVRTRQLLKRGWGAGLVKAKMRNERVTVNDTQISEAIEEIGGDAPALVRALIQKALRRLERGGPRDTKELRNRVVKILSAKGHRYGDFSKILDEELAPL